MPALSKYKFSEPEQLHDLAIEESLSRKTAIQRRLSYYKGEHKKWLIDPETKMPTAENVTINVARKIIDQSASFLFGDSPDITSGDKTVDVLIESLEDANEDDVFYTNLGKAGSISGHAFVKLIPDPVRGVRWVMQDAELVSVFWSPSDGKTPIAYKIEWQVGKDDYRQDIAWIPEISKWFIRDLKREDKASWQIVKDTVWEWPFSPIVDWQNLPDFTSYYGESDLTSLDLNDSINFTASNINRILKYHAHPKTIAIGASAEDIKATAVDGLWSIANPEAKVFNLEMQSDLSSSMAYLQFMQAAFYSQEQAVDLSSMKDRIGQLTNFGLRTLFSDALSKNSIKQLLYGYGIKEIIYRSLAMLGHTVDPRNIDVKFEDPLPLNEKEIADMVKLQIESGTVSKQTGSEMEGHDWAVESKQMTTEKQSTAGDIGKMLADAARQTDIQNQPVDNAQVVNE